MKNYLLLLATIAAALLLMGALGYFLFAKNAPSSGQNSPSPLRESFINKMKTYQNYQLELTISSINGQATISRKILRLKNKQATQIIKDGQLDDKNVIYLDGSEKKSYQYSKELNLYTEDKIDQQELDQGKPEYYFQNLSSNLAFKKADSVDGERVNIYTASSADVTQTVYLSQATELPIKIITKNANGESSTTFKFSRFNEIQDYEVTLPPRAQKAEKN